MTSLSLAEVVEAAMPQLIARHGHHLNSDHYQALRAISGCRAGPFGEVLWHCSGCGHHDHSPNSCGHRACPRCQNHATSQWLARQQDKLLPVEYFMVTFTLPAELRGVALAHQKPVYSALFSAASDTLKTFGLNAKLNINMGLVAVLHTHSRKLDYHPHVHVVVPGGGINARQRQWRKLKGKYLFNAFALATVFRAKMLQALNQAGVGLPAGLPDKWVVDCTRVGRGRPALQYLSRYLYRGVIQEKNLVSFDGQNITFRYINSNSQKTEYRTLPVADFLWRLMMHVLPSGFRRVRDYGFLHGNAKRTLKLVQLLLHIITPEPIMRSRPDFLCQCCATPMTVIAINRRRVLDG